MIKNFNILLFGYTNKKIKGATCKVCDNYTFKSLLEYSCYNKLKESGLNFSYESEKIILWEKFKPESVTIYCPLKVKTGKYGKELVKQNRTLLNITYTPDFIVEKGIYKIYFDVKGISNDIYPIKKKMFLKYLEEKDDGKKYIFFEPHNVRQMLQAIEIINNL